MSKKFYIALGEIDEPSFGPNCCVFAYKKEIESLKATVASLSEELSLSLQICSIQMMAHLTPIQLVSQWPRKFLIYL